MKILVLNAGSSSLKFSLFSGVDSHLVTHGVIDHIDDASVEAYTRALTSIEHLLQEKGLEENLGDCDAVGHRVVHGGELFQEATLIDTENLTKMKTLSHLAPLHNPINLVPIEIIRARYPALKQVAVFDTAFHQTLPEKAYRYALPNDLYTTHRIRRYGFHGTSHQYIAKRMADHLAKPLSELNIISMHLGNGASVCAIQNGKSIDTSMGFTPLEGLIMGTRSGDIDPAIPLYLIEALGYSAQEVDHLLNHQSGLIGLTGENDMQTILSLAQQGNLQAQLAVEMFIYHLIKVVGGYLAIMNEVDALVFTGGIGEHAADIRQKTINGFSPLFKIHLDHSANDTLVCEGRISTPGSAVECWVLPTDEEWEIAQQTLQRLS
ncbi:acetate kinase [Hydrogenovibrio sp. 3SP14C1]|uniref:acetate/propionate family kinase n=1 Tax=Hydrogenovibrio sp. 3SP14C1 TaxID=3038774 RepID=UPI002417C79C|nr:acetate kinase [Hydrogenovibrio sp. 3SP14C1]MDG4813582.1 acetate kinase [Hydrogenovibrio sp. 3SP14C1]